MSAHMAARMAARVAAALMFAVLAACGAGSGSTDTPASGATAGTGDNGAPATGSSAPTLDTPVRDATAPTPEPAAPGYRIGGTIAGLAAGKQLMLANGADSVIVSADGSFNFPTRSVTGAAYAVTVSTPPVGQTCTVSNASGNVAQADVGDVAITCAATAYVLSGTVTGLGVGKSVVIQDTVGGSVLVSADGRFSMPGRIPYNGSYSVSVAANPSGQTCSLSNFSGTGMVADVGNVGVVCSTNSYIVMGTVTGLGSGGTVVIENNGVDSLQLGADGVFGFAGSVADGGTYLVTVRTQPNGATCSVNNASGVVAGSNVVDVQVICSALSYGVGGTITGLPTGEQVTLSNFGDPVVVQADGTFTFPTPVSYGAGAYVTVVTQPTTAECRVTDGSRLSITSPVTDLKVECRRQMLYANMSISGTPKVMGWYTRADGSMTQVHTRNTTSAVTSMVYSPLTDRLYTVDGSTPGITRYAFDGDGNLVFDAMLLLSYGASSLSLDASGRYLLAVQSVGKQIDVFDLTTGLSIGGLSTAPATPVSAVATADRSRVAVFFSDRSLASYLTAGDLGSLGSASSSVTATGIPVAVSYSLAAHPSAQTVYIGRSGGVNAGISTFDLSAVTPSFTSSVALTGSVPGLALDENAQNLIYLNANRMGFAPLGAGGAISGSPTVATLNLSTATNLVQEPTGRFTYLGNTNGSISTYDRGNGTQVTRATALGILRTMTMRRW